VTGTVGAGVGVAGVRVAAAGVGVAGMRVAGMRVAGVRVAGVRVAGEAEGELGDELGDNRIAVDIDGAALGGVGATQPPRSEANNATVTRRVAGCREVLMFFQTTEQPPNVRSSSLDQNGAVSARPLRLAGTHDTWASCRLPRLGG
jgi:hypothetical protein